METAAMGTMAATGTTAVVEITAMAVRDMDIITAMEMAAIRDISRIVHQGASRMWNSRQFTILSTTADIRMH